MRCQDDHAAPVRLGIKERLSVDLFDEFQRGELAIPIVVVEIRSNQFACGRPPPSSGQPIVIPGDLRMIGCPAEQCRVSRAPDT
jgi:hypothetical protein